MLRKRSTRPVTSKQAVVGDHSNSPWQPPEKSTKSASFFLTSPSFFKRFFNSCSKDYIDPMMSPTSILDTKPFSAVAHFWVAENTTKNPTTLSKNEQHSWEQTNNTKGIGLALIDENSETNNNNLNNNSTTTKQQKRKLVVFGSQLRIQVPPMPNSSVFPCFSPESPKEFGIKTPRNNFWPFGNKDTLSQVHPEESVSPISGNGNLNMSEIEQSEDYTCVISHGPNPKTTHIFGNCIVESCCGVVGGGSFGTTRRNVLSSSGNSTPSSLEHENFLSFCHHCKKKLGEGNDIYMYRGEKAFCSQECRCQEMLFDDGVEN